MRVDGRPVAFAEGDSVLIAMLRAGLHPTGGGCLCLAGDCCHCLATVDGVAYTRTCQVLARAAVEVERQHRGGAVPPLVRDGGAGGGAAFERHIWCDVAVIGAGSAGRKEAERARAAGREAVVLDAAAGQEVVGVYAGPRVVARADGAMLIVHPRTEIVVATGAAEIQPVAPGTELAGLVTARAAARLARAGIELGRVVAIGTPPAGVEAAALAGELVRCEGEGRLSHVVVRGADGDERRHPCDTAAFGLGFHPRDALARMGRGLSVPVRAVGDAARDADVPPCPRAGTVCACAGVAVGDLERVWEHGFHELELVKRATLAGTGACQGAACLPWIRSFLAARGGALQPPFTARPMSRQPTVGEIAAGAFHPPTARTPLDAEHRSLGARMERAGGWWRPWSYGDPAREYRAVRETVSLGDVGTLGKLVVAGPDAAAFLEHVYPTAVSRLAVGRSRYALLLDERGYVLDDGLVCRDADTRYLLTLTSAGASFGELWLRDWAEAGGWDVRIFNRTMSNGAINITGPRAAELLRRAGVDRLPGFARHRPATVAGIDCHAFRLSFTGELSYELHHAAADSVALWRRLLAIGRHLEIAPHGLETLFGLRLEKGHLVVGIDTDFDSTPRRLDHEWAVDVGKPDFVGRPALLRTGKQPLDRQLVGLEMDGPAPREGAVVWHDGGYAGYVTSSFTSPVLGRAVMLAWLRLVDGELPTEVVVDERTARRVPTPFYDRAGERARAKVVDANGGDGVETPPDGWPSARRCAVPGTARLERLPAVRVVARPSALDTTAWPEGAIVLRTAGDEALVVGVDGVAPSALTDRHAIVAPETGLAGLWLDTDEARALAARACAWPLPVGRPAFAQGAMAEVPVKLWLEADRVLLVVPAPYAATLERRLGWSGER